MIVTLVQVLFVLIGLAMVIACFFPNWNFSQPVIAMQRIFGLVVGLVVLFIIYYVVMLLLGAMPPP
jgi:hypothetical protein